MFVQNTNSKDVLQAIQAEESTVPPIDVEATAINSPTGTLSTGLHTVNVTISNLGGLDQSDIPVSCTIYNDRMEVVLDIQQAPEYGHFENEAKNPGIYYESTQIVYTRDTTISDIPALDQTNVDFLPAWNAHTPGKYRIVIETLVDDDYGPDNNILVGEVEIQ